MTKISDSIFHDETAARAHLEAIRWPKGTICPLCGCSERVKPLGGQSMGPGWYFCADCRGKFTVRTGSIYERSHIPLHKWVHAVHLLSASKKGMSAHQLHRMLGVTYKTAWFLAHRIRESMKDTLPPAMGGSGTKVQADETYIGTKEEYRKGGKKKAYHGGRHKMMVFSLVTEGKSRSFHVDRTNAATIHNIIARNVKPGGEIHTDESPIYKGLGPMGLTRKSVNHSREQYVGKDGQTTNNVENFFSVFKRGMKGVYQHCAEKHLQRYLNEFDFRFNTRHVDDFERAMIAKQRAEGKRLTYRRAKGEQTHW